MINLMDVLQPECIAPNQHLESKESALESVAAVAARSPLLKDAGTSDLLARLRERETLGSTGFGKGIAIPHCRTPQASDFVVGIITVPEGVDFEALDDAPVRLIIFIIAPAEASNEHIRLLSNISQTLLIPGVVDEMLAQNDPEALRECFLRYTRTEMAEAGQKKQRLVYVLVEDEDIFRDLLQALAGLDAAGLVVIEAEQSAAYLAKMPLFAGFWSEEVRGFCRVVMMVVDEGLSNEALRLVESVAGTLDEREGVLLLVQDLAYTAGTLLP